MPTIRTAQFPQAAARASGDAAFRHLLDRLVGQLADARSQAVEQLTEPVWEQLRARAHYVRAEAVQHLDYYLELLDRSVRHNGGHVHFARDAAEANQLVLEIAQAHGVRRAVKSKSMLAEELGITQHLEQHGIETVETDLGEYINQLANEPPFHMMAPAMHKTRQEVADLFQRHLDAQPTTEVGELTKVARDAIRQRFVGAEMGITGANFLVAETGMVVLVTNDGSDRMTAALPRIHVAIAGIDKVVPAIEDVAVLLKLLARSATGQPITSYTTFIGGPKAPGEEDGPEEFHVVVVDNGRTKLLEDPELREALYCIKCGACANVCPVYQQVGGHTYGWIYSGPIGAVISPVMTGLKEAKALPYASTLCGACGDVCPVKIDLPRLLVHLRTKLADGDARTERSSSWVQRLAMRRWADTVKTRVAMERAPGLSRLLRIPGTQGHRVPLPLGSSQDLPSPSVQSFHQLWHERLSVSEESDRHEPRRITAQAPQVEEAHVSDVAANAEAPAGTERGSGKRGGEQAPLTSRVQESTAKESFLQHVRVALGRQKPLTHAPGHPPLKTTLPRHQEKVRTVHARVEARRAQLIPRLLEGAAQVGWEVHRVNSSIEAARIVGEIARRLRVRRAVRSAQEIFRRVEVDGALRTAGVSLVTLASGRQRRASDIRHLAREADLGIVGADYMVADTASCALIPRKGLARITSQAPPALVVLAEAEQVVESLDDLLALRRLEHLRTRVRTPHIMTLISGPSRTMDIELTMTTGVHGPGQVFLVLIAP